ncbi:MAG: hypothetical protein AAF982_06395 [Pseudomonadota bacterium]
MKLKSLFKSRSKRSKAKKSFQSDQLVKQFEYMKDGGFDYDLYRAWQIRKARKDELDNWADEKTLGVISEYAKTKRGIFNHVICHGSKSGMEAVFLGERLNCPAFGTDLTPPPHAQNVVEWDFHERRDDWVGLASVMYTNSLDHAYDPKKAMDTWVEQLEPEGLIFIEHTMLSAPEAASFTDPFGAHPLVMPYLVLEWGGGRYCVTDVIKPPFRKPYWKPAGEVREDTDLDIWLFVVSRI